MHKIRLFVSFRCLVAGAMAVAGVSVSLPARAEGELARLNAGVRAYREGHYPRVIELLTPLLYPQIALPTQDDAIQAHKLLAISYLFVKDEDSAKKEFRAILAQRPDYSFEPLSDPVAAVDLFELVKRDNAEEMERILAKSRIEEDRDAARRSDEERKRAEQERLSRRVVEQRITEKPYWLNFIPFGVGQFQNGQTTKGYALLGSQALLGALSLSTALYLRVSYPDNRVPSDEWDTAQALRWTQVISGGLCIASIIYGIVDALYYWEPTSIEVREYEKPLALVGDSMLMPLVSTDSVGLGWGGRF